MRTKVMLIVGAAIALMLAAAACASWGFIVEDDRPAAGKEGASMSHEEAFSAWLDGFLKKFQPLYKADALAWWDASISGKDEDFKKRLDLDVQMDHLFADRDDFAKLKAWREGGQVKDTLLARQLEVLYLGFLAKQVDTKILDRMNELAGQVDQIFNTFRAEIGGKKFTENDIRKVLRESTSNAEVEAAWKAYQAVGKKVEPKLKELVKLRNESARQVGFPNFHALQLATQEFDGNELLALFDRLDRDTGEIFKALKAEVDLAMAKRYGVKVADLRPWNYQDLFFQEAPPIYEADLDRIYKGRKLEELVRRFYDSIGLDVDDILARSDLYEKPGKSPHAFCTDIDREGDVRTLQNLVSNETWMGTILHELGHGVYSKYIDRKLPYVLRDSAHIFTTEGVAMFFGRQSKDAAWIRDNLGLKEDEVKPVAGPALKMLKLEQIMFSRWTQVMLRFEKGLYENPDQDLGKLWWDLKAKYQLLTPEPGRNEPDYAAKIHIVSVPVYYHNYMLGELFASMIYARLRAERGVKPGEPLHLTGDKAAGAYFREKVFAPGMTMPWQEFVKFATGEPLSARAFAAQFMDK